MSSPTARTLAWLKDSGYLAGVVERHNTFSGKKTDLFGFVDIVAVKNTETVGVQATSGAHVAERVAKIVALDTARTWLDGGRRILVVGWRRYRKPEDGRWWRPVLREVRMEDLSDAR